eukprot:TRINITY_DN92745_c0_g1_i1.p1 TRINITY_DN92745_c0_g1~~TRINITY_DN92745_c0_g1_i1.p1  ORF type:complete len:347 (+),score=56.48 TRINITY_DN92745_c0_g1_i1:86-1042(+)
MGRLGDVKKGAPKVDWCPVTLDGQSFGNLRHSELDECSGLAASRKNPGLYWVNNDSGDWARLFGIDKEGKHLARLHIIDESTGEHVQAIDWEDLAVGPGPDNSSSYIYIADTGDNHRQRSDGVQIYRGVEPHILPGQDPDSDVYVNVTRFDVTYPEGPRDCEALFVDPVSKRVYVITKAMGEAEVRWVSLEDESPLTFKLVGSIPVDLVTAADISPSGDLIAIRSYGEVRMWGRKADTLVEESLFGTGCKASHKDEQQGEAIAFGADGDHYLTASEGLEAPVWFFSLSTGFYSSLLDAPAQLNETSANRSALPAEFLP